MNSTGKVSDKDVIAVIKAIVLHPKALDALINASIKQEAILNKRELDASANDQLRSIYTSDSFLKGFVGPFKEVFSDEEIFGLLEIYQSTMMKKLLERSNDLFNPLYYAMSEKVKEIKGKTL